MRARGRRVWLVLTAALLVAVAARLLLVAPAVPLREGAASAQPAIAAQPWPAFAPVPAIPREPARVEPARFDEHGQADSADVVHREWVGRVVDADDRGVAGATVGCAAGDLALTDDHGRFRLVVVHGEDPGPIMAVSGDLTQAGAVAVDLATDESICVVLGPAGRIGGRVHDELGRPRAGQQVHLARDSLGEGGATSTAGRWRRLIEWTLNNGGREDLTLQVESIVAFTDAAGCYALPCIGTGGATLTFWPVGTPPDVRRLDIRVDPTFLTVDCELRRGASLSGFFVGVGAEQAERIVATQLVYPGTGSATVAGTVLRSGFSFADLPPGSYSIQASVVAEPELVGRVDGIELAAGEQRAGVAVVLQPVVTLRGVVHAAGGAPLAGQRIEMGPRGVTDARNAESDEDGLFAIAGGFPGEYDVMVHGEPGFLGWHTTVSFSHAGQELWLAVPLERGITVHGQVRNARGELQEGVLIFLRSGQQGMNETSDTAGRFAFTSVAPAPIRLYARFGGDSGQDESVVRDAVLVAGTDAVQVDLHLQASAEIRGTLHDTAGQPIDGEIVTATAIDNDRVTRQATTDAAGRFTIRGLYPGGYLLTLATQAQVVVAHATVTSGLPVPPLHLIRQ